MIPVYAVSVVVGMVGLLAWVAAVAVADMVDGWAWADPEARFGVRGRVAVAAVIGFGMAGMSSSFGGWPAVAAFGAAVGGAVLMGSAAVIFGPKLAEADS